MPSTYAPVQALNFCKRYIKNMPFQEVQARVLDRAMKYIWMASPWRWTIGTLNAINIVNGQQDYTLAPPNDFLYPLYAYMSDGVTTPQYFEIEPTFPTNVVISGMPNRLAYVGSNTWRLYPIPYCSGTNQLLIFYKKEAPEITVKNSYTAGVQIFDDEWFWVYENIVLYEAYLYADDQRAGSARITNDGKWELTGALGKMEVSINFMREREKLPIFGFQTAPDPKVAIK